MSTKTITSKPRSVRSTRSTKASRGSPTTKLKVITWNVNGLKVRENLIKKLITEESPDFLLLQEIKTLNIPQTFLDFLEEHNYYHAENLQHGANGVMTISKVEPAYQSVFRPYNNEARYLETFYQYPGSTKRNIIIVNLYMPQGSPRGTEREKINDITESTTYTEKLKYYTKIAAHLTKLDRRANKLILGGDFNIVSNPEVDIHLPVNQAVKVISSTPGEVQTLNTFMQSLNLIDIWREKHPKDILYTFYTYRQAASVKKNKGYRLDYLLIPKLNMSQVESSDILMKYRTLVNTQKPSDHAPVIGIFRY